MADETKQVDRKLTVPSGRPFTLKWTAPANIGVTNTFSIVKEAEDGTLSIGTKDIAAAKPAGSTIAETITITVTKDDGSGPVEWGFKEKMPDPKVAMGQTPDKPPRPYQLFTFDFLAREQAVFVFTVKYPEAAKGQTFTQTVTVTDKGWVSPADEPRKFVPGAPYLLDFNYATDDADFKAKVKPPANWNGILQGGTPDGDALIRATFVEAFSRMNGLGAEDRPAGRAAAYIDAVGLAEKPNPAFYTQDQPGSANSSCAIFIRIMWRLLGVDSPVNLDPPYSSANAHTGFNALLDTGRSHGACTESGFDKFTPQPGDCVHLYVAIPDAKPPLADHHEHILTILKYDPPPKNLMVSMDGGQISSDGHKDGKCMSIRFIARNPTGLGTSNVTFPPDSSPARKLAGWIDVTKLKFSRKVILPRRVAGGGLPDPPPSDPNGKDIGATWP